MKILGLDQSSSRSGYCLMVDGVPVHYGCVDHHKITDSMKRIETMYCSLRDLICMYEPDAVGIEADFQQGNPKTTILLSQMAGSLFAACWERGIKFHLLMPSTWRKELGYRQGRGVERPELKAQSLKYVKERFGIVLADENDDTAEAICIATAMDKILKADYGKPMAMGTEKPSTRQKGVKSAKSETKNMKKSRSVKGK